MPLFNQRVTQREYALEVKSEELCSRKKRKKKKEKKTVEAPLPSLIKYPWMGGDENCILIEWCSLERWVRNDAAAQWMKGVIIFSLIRSAAQASPVNPLPPSLLSLIQINKLCPHHVWCWAGTGREGGRGVYCFPEARCVFYFLWRHNQSSLFTHLVFPYLTIYDFYKVWTVINDTYIFLPPKSAASCPSITGVWRFFPWRPICYYGLSLRGALKSRV